MRLWRILEYTVNTQRKGHRPFQTPGCCLYARFVRSAAPYSEADSCGGNGGATPRGGFALSTFIRLDCDKLPLKYGENSVNKDLLDYTLALLAAFMYDMSNMYHANDYLTWPKWESFAKMKVRNCVPYKPCLYVFLLCVCF